MVRTTVLLPAQADVSSPLYVSLPEPVSRLLLRTRGCPPRRAICEHRLSLPAGPMATAEAAASPNAFRTL